MVLVFLLQIQAVYATVKIYLTFVFKVGCIPPASFDCVGFYDLQMSAPVGGSKVNKFEQISHV